MKKDAVRLLINSRNRLLNELKRVIQTGSFNYRTFGTEIENYISNWLIKFFTQEGFIRSKKDYFIAPDKNYFPDFKLRLKPSIAIEYKTGNSSKLSKGRWVVCKNSNNDMGTLSSWPAKLKKFGGENIYYIFVIYNFNDRVKEILNVQIAPFYQFIGLNKASFLKYREKDGNLRPKNFDADSPIKTYGQFKELFNRTIVYRSKRIIKKHRLIIKKAGRNS